jgi:hypothetical protein
MITIAMPGRTNLQPEIAKQVMRKNQGLLEQGEVFSDMRIPVIARLKERFTNLGLNIHVVEARAGERAINMLPLKTYEALERILQSEAVMKFFGNHRIEPKDLLIMMEGRRATELIEHEDFKKAQFVCVHPAVKPEELLASVYLFQGPPGPLGAAKFLESAVKGDREREVAVQGTANRVLQHQL